MTEPPGFHAEDRPTRRQFAATLAALAAVPPAAAPAADADPVVTAAEGLYEIARGRFGKYLTEEQLREVKRGVSHIQRAADFLRRVKLQNGDEPAVVFRADVP